jgi:hypothetical protein
MMNRGIDEIREFIGKCNKLLEDNSLQPLENKMKTDFQPGDSIFAACAKYDIADLRQKYKNLKNSNEISSIIGTYINIKKIVDFDREQKPFGCLDLPDNLSNSFLINNELDKKLLDFSIFDFGFPYKTFESCDDFNRIILLVLYHCYNNSHSLYKLYISPDVDTDKFADEFIKKIDEVKVMIPGCDEAFKVIRGSSKLLKKNFGEYYKAFILSGNPSAIFDGFLGDVINKCKEKPIAISQIKRIIAFIKDKINQSGYNKDPIAKKLFETTDSLINSLDK